MNLLYVNQFAVTPDMPGGTRHYDLGRLMLPHGIQTEIIASDLNLGSRSYWRRKGATQTQPIIEQKNGVKFHWLYAESYEKNDWRRAFSMWTYGLRVEKYLDKVVKPDLVIGSSPHLFQARAACAWARRNHVPFFLEVRDLWPETLIDMTGRVGLGARLLKTIANDLYGKALKIVTLAKGTGEKLAGYGINPEKIIYIPNGIDPESFPVFSEQEKKAIRVGLGLPDSGFLAVYAGAHGRANGLETVLEVARLVQDEKIRFVLIGDGPEKQKLVSLAQEMNLKNVDFISPMAKEEVYRALGAMDLGLLTLIDAGVFRYAISPNKLFDYWGAQLPVIASVPGEIGDLVIEAKAGAVADSGDSRRIAALVDEACNTREKWKCMGKNGRSFVENRFNRETLAGLLAEACNRAVSKI